MCQLCGNFTGSCTESVDCGSPESLRQNADPHVLGAPDLSGHVTDMLGLLGRSLIGPFESILSTAFALWGWQVSAAMIAGVVALVLAASQLHIHISKELTAATGSSLRSGRRVGAGTEAFAADAPAADAPAADAGISDPVAREPADVGAAGVIKVFSAYTFACALCIYALSYLALPAALFVGNHIAGLA